MSIKADILPFSDLGLEGSQHTEGMCSAGTYWRNDCLLHTLLARGSGKASSIPQQAGAPCAGSALRAPQEVNGPFVISALQTVLSLRAGAGLPTFAPTGSINDVRK